MQLSAAAKLPGELVESRLKIIFSEKYARKFGIIELTAKLVGIDERCAENFKRSGRAASFRDIRPFEQTHAGINGRRVEHWHVRRGHHPRQASFIEPHGSIPILHR